MQNTIEIKHLSREDKLRVMEAIWEEISGLLLLEQVIVRTAMILMEILSAMRLIP